MEPLGCCWESFGKLSGTFGSLLENVSKIIHKVSKFYQKSPKGDPKVEEGSSKTVSRIPPPETFSVQLGLIFFYKKMLKQRRKLKPDFVPQV